MKCQGGHSYCDGKDIRLVQMKSASLKGNVFEGQKLYLCAECRKFENGQFKFVK